MATGTGALRHRCGEVLSRHAQGWAADGEGAPSAPPGCERLETVRAAAAAELGLVLVPRGTPPERLRGLREGWVHWFVGTPVVHPETGARYGFDEERGRIVALARGGCIPERPGRR